MAGEIEHLKGKDFSHNPENINRKGRPISIKNQLKEILLKDGELPIPADQLIRKKIVNDKEYYIFKLPTQEALALKLVNMAMAKGANGFNALKLMLETFDGKAQQSIEHDLSVSNVMSKEEIKDISNTLENEC